MRQFDDTDLTLILDTHLGPGWDLVSDLDEDSTIAAEPPTADDSTATVFTPERLALAEHAAEVEAERLHREAEEFLATKTPVEVVYAPTALGLSREMLRQRCTAELMIPSLMIAHGAGL